MKFISLLIDGDNMKKACFLCFDLNGENKLYEEIIIQSSKINLKTSLYKIVMHLMPGYEILFSQACKACSNAIISMFSIIQDHLVKKDMLEKNVIAINENIPNNISVQEKCIIKLGRDIPNSIATVENNEENVNKDLQCTSFEEQFSSDILIKESKLHVNSETVICHICGKSCFNTKSLKAHLNCHSEKQCPYCSKILKTHSHFNKHVGNHRIKRTVSKRSNRFLDCPNCHYYCHNKADLEAHTNKVHMKIKPYECDRCSKSFCKKSNLSAHRMTHFKIKRLICEICGKDFTYKKTLDEHLRLHGGDKIFKCDICQRSFTTQSRRNEHIKRNHSNVYISCSVCNKKYTLKKELNNHMKRFHPEVS